MLSKSRIRRVIWRYAIVLFSFACADLHLLASEDAVPREILEDWKSYLAFAEKLTGKFEYRSTFGGEVQSHVTVEFRSRLGCKLYLEQPNSESSKASRAMGYNDKYSFTLRKQKRESSDWIATDISIGDDRSNSPGYLDVPQYFRNHSQVLLHPVTGLSLIELVQKPYFRLVSLSPRVANGESVLEMRFESPHNQEEDSSNCVQKGTIQLAPKSMHVIRHAEVECKLPNDSWRIDSTYGFETAADGKPIPKSIRTIFQRAGQADFVIAIQYDLALSDESAPEGDFTLSAFGLPEPRETRKGEKRYTVFVLAGVILLFGGGYLIRKRFRSQSQP